MLETKKLTTQIVGSASSVPHSFVRWPERRRPSLLADTRPDTSARLHFGPCGGTTLYLVGTEQAEDVGVLEVLHVDVAGRDVLGELLERRHGVPHGERVEE